MTPQKVPEKQAWCIHHITRDPNMMDVIDEQQITITTEDSMDLIRISLDERIYVKLGYTPMFTIYI